MINKINFMGDIEDFYTYRKAVVPPKVSIQIPDLWEKVRRFVEDNGYKMDNHIAFKTTDGLYFGYSDNILTISDNIFLF